jgi:hypothetical protein
MPKMVNGSVVCRISFAPESTGKKFYCDHCGELFDDRHDLPCDRKPVEAASPEIEFERVIVQARDVDFSDIVPDDWVPPEVKKDKKK